MPRLLAPANEPNIHHLLTHARLLLASSGQSVETAANLHRHENNTNLFLQLCNFINTSCPPCSLMTAVAGWLKTAIWGSSVLSVLTNEKKPELQAVHDLLGAHASISSVQPLVATKTEALQPLHYIHQEGSKWDKSAEALLTAAANWGGNGGPSEKVAREIKSTLGHVVNLPIKCPCEDRLRNLHVIAKKRRDELASQQSRGKKRSSVKSRTSGNKRPKKA
jgi:hypothetical protein